MYTIYFNKQTNQKFKNFLIRLFITAKMTEKALNCVCVNYTHQ